MPPSYPNLKVPGVNAPPPPGASWGFAPGQYGKPPVGEDGHPLFGGDPLGINELSESQRPTNHGEPVERNTWGVLRAEGESDEEQEEEEDEEESDDEEGDEDMTGTQTSMTAASGFPSEIGGTESIGGEFTLRKQRRGIETEEPHAAPRSAYQVLPEKSIESTGFMGGERAYNLDAARRDEFGDGKRKRKAGDVDVSISVDELEASGKMSKEALRQQYEAQRKAEEHGTWQAIDHDDLSEMIAAERKRTKRDERRRF